MPTIDTAAVPGFVWDLGCATLQQIILEQKKEDNT